MDFQEFTGEVQHCIEAGKQGRAVRATRAVLGTLGERLDEGGVTDVASPLPMEIDRFVVDVEEHGQKFGYREFLDRVVERAWNDDLAEEFGKAGRMERADADYTTKAIVDLVVDLMPGGQETHLRDQLPREFEEMFEFVEAEETAWARYE